MATGYWPLSPDRCTGAGVKKNLQFMTRAPIFPGGDDDKVGWEKRLDRHDHPMEVARMRRRGASNFSLNAVVCFQLLSIVRKQSFSCRITEHGRLSYSRLVRSFRAIDHLPSFFSYPALISFSAKRDTGPCPSADENREDQWDCKEAKADDEDDEKEGTEDIGEKDESDTSLLRFTRKRPLSSAKGKSRVKRRSKRRRFPSPLSSDEATETGDESDISSSAPSKPHHISNLRPTPSLSIDRRGDTSDGGTMELAGGRSDEKKRIKHLEQGFVYKDFVKRSPTSQIQQHAPLGKNIDLQHARCDTRTNEGFQTLRVLELNGEAAHLVVNPMDLASNHLLSVVRGRSIRGRNTRNGVMTDKSFFHKLNKVKKVTTQ